MEIIAELNRYICVSELTFHIGNPKFRPRSVLVNEPDDSWNPGSSLLAKLLALYIRIEEFAQRLYSYESPPDWHAESPLRRLQGELNECLLVQSEYFCDTESKLQDAIRSLSVTRIQCSLLWQCCELILNRIFLPISRTRGTAVETDKAGMDIRFQNLPPAFLAERANVCKRSAVTISIIGRKLITSPGFHLVSYTCYRETTRGRLTPF